MLELFSLTDLTGTLSYAVIALSYMMTRIFWLRVVAVIGLFLQIAYFRLSGGDTESRHRLGRHLHRDQSCP